MPTELNDFFYLSALLVTMTCMVLVDWRYHLFFFRAPVRAALVVAAGTAFFLLWDVAGIALDVFFQGTGPYMTGIMLGPELPLEELFFLLFLCHLTMVMVLGAEKLLTRKGSP